MRTAVVEGAGEREDEGRASIRREVGDRREVGVDVESLVF